MWVCGCLNNLHVPLKAFVVCLLSSSGGRCSQPRFWSTWPCQPCGIAASYTGMAILYNQTMQNTCAKHARVHTHTRTPAHPKHTTQLQQRAASTWQSFSPGRLAGQKKKGRKKKAGALEVPHLHQAMELEREPLRPRAVDPCQALQHDAGRGGRDDDGLLQPEGVQADAWGE